jgi:uncharacterized protein
MSAPSSAHPARQPIAPVWHAGVVLAMLAAFSGFSIYLRMGSNNPRLGHLGLYSATIAFEWAVFAVTLRYSNSAFIDYVARVFRDRRSVWLDVLAALALGAVSFALAPILVFILGRSGWVSLEGMRPNNGIEIAFWIVTAISAGIVEETVFRGYLQQQLTGWTGRTSIGILGQGAMFGLIHGYQGWKNMALVSTLGIVFGIAVWLRKGIRPNVIAHAVVDILAAF